MYKPLDFVKTPCGNYAIITETNDIGKRCSIAFIGKENTDGERSAWWELGELEIIDSLPSLLARKLCHPFGTGRTDAARIYPKIGE